MGIGERLKQEREMKNMSLDDIQKVTKIQTRYLDAIENENFKAMPGNFYVRAFIKEYANALGLKADELMEEYQHDLPFEQEENVALSRVKSSKKNKVSVKTPAIFSLLPTIIVVLLIISIFVVVWLFKQGTFSDNENNPSTPEEQNEASDPVQMPPSNSEDQGDASENEEEEEENENGETQQNEQDDQVEDNENEQPQTTLTLDNYENNESFYTMKTTQDTINLSFTSEVRNWLEVEDGEGNSLYYKTLTNNESPLELELSEVDQLYFRIGEADTLTIEINGTIMELSEEINPENIQKFWIDVVE